VCLGTLLNPLNSSMISVALIGAARDLAIDISTATWLISSFYLVGAFGMPLAGRLADLYGPRRVFRAGMAVVLVASALAALAPSFGWLLVWRIIQAFGSATGSPSGQAMFRTASATPRPPAGALGALSIANNVSAAFGPVLGGLVVALLAWQGIFWINVPITLLGLYMAWRWLPPDPPGNRVLTPSSVLRELDLPGTALFALAIVGLLAFLLSVGNGPDWWLALVAVVSGGALVRRELRHPTPFLDFRFLRDNRRLVGLFAQFAAVSVIFYAAFFGLPLWLQQVRELEPAVVGLIVLPISGTSVLLIPLATRLLAQRGVRPTLMVGACAMLVGLLLQLLVNASTPLVALLGVTAVIGVAGAFNNLGLQAALYQLAPAERMGTATGQFQVFRYVGATLCTALLGVLFAGAATTDGLHLLALVLAPVAVVLIWASGRA
jgi:MFS family permease